MAGPREVATQDISSDGGNPKALPELGKAHGEGIHAGAPDLVAAGAELGHNLGNRDSVPNR